MTGRPLVLGGLRADGHNIYRSGIRWAVPPGTRCAAREVFAYCAISLAPEGPFLRQKRPFPDEELQVAFASPNSGRILSAGPERGGVLGVHSVDAWRDDDVIAFLEPEDEGVDAAPIQLRLLVLAGRRVTNLANSDAGILPGWLERRRGWWSEPGATPPTLLCLGLCDSSGAVAGEHNAFLEMFAAAPFPLHCVDVSERPLAFATPVLLDQLERAPAQFDAIAADLHRAFAAASTTPTAKDWIASGALLGALRRCPIRDRYTLLTPAGAIETKPADVILLSLSSEPRSILRHKTLGYHLYVMPHHQDDAGPVFRAWLAAAFAPVKRSVDDIKRDYATLIEAVARTTGARIAIVNRMSTLGHEDIASYAAFDSPLGDTLSVIAAKEMNLMLHDLSETHDVAIVDVDALAAAFGGAEHVPDGIHQSGPMQQAVRAAVLQLLVSRF